MKIIKTTTLLLLSAVLFSFTNAEELSEHIQELQTCETAAQYFEIAKKFESTEPQDDQDWHPNYYAAYSYVLSAFANTDQSKLDETLDLAQQHLDRAQKISPKNDEILCVASMIYSARIMVDPEKRGYKFGQKSAAMLEQAMLINSDNPRIPFLIGQSKMYMPANYGGGCANAKPVLEEAIRKFNSFEKTNANSPDWGKDETQKLLKSCSQ